MRHLSKRTLALHKRISEDNLPDTLEVFNTPASKGAGGMVTKGARVKHGYYRCRIMPIGEVEEVVRADGLELGARWVIVVPLVADVKIGHQVEVTGSGFKRTLDIVGTQNPRSFATLRRVFAREVVK